MQTPRHYGKFYVYSYTDVRVGREGEVIYIGKGYCTKKNGLDRMQSHWNRRARIKNRLFAGVLNKIGEAGLDPVREVVSWHDDEPSAFAAEIAEIAKHRSRKSGGTLCNLTEGGDGPQGMVHSDGARLKIGRAARAHWSDPEYVAKVAAKKLATMAMPEAKAKKASASAKNWSNPEYKMRTAAAIKAARGSEEGRAKTSRLSAVIWADPERRAAASAKMKQHLQSPEGKAQRADALRKRWADPDARARLMAARQKAQPA